MRTIHTLNEMIETARGWLASGKVGFVFLSGNLHEGHLTLLHAARSASEILVVGLLDKYQLLANRPGAPHPPRSRQQDLHILYNSPIDILFAPHPQELYPSALSTFVTLTNPLAQHLDQTHYPGYTRTISTALVKALHLVRPDVAFFGQKHILQVTLFQQLVRDLNIDVQICTHPTARTNRGLAISARNRFLSADEMQAACVLYQALSQAKTLIDGGERQAPAIIQTITQQIARTPLVRLEQILICHPDTFAPCSEITPSTLILIETQIGQVSLSDSLFWSAEGTWSR